MKNPYQSGIVIVKGATKAGCPNFGKLIGGCRFEGRYDEKPLSGSMKFNRIEATEHQLKAILVHRVYVRDVCIRCGATIERTLG